MSRVDEVIIVENRGFDPNLCNAAQTTRLGYQHGFEGIGKDVVFSSVSDLGDAIREIINPLVWLCYDDYSYLRELDLKALKNVPHIVQVNVWFDGMERLHEKYNAPSPGIPPELRKKILDSEPDFLWCSAPEAYFDSYQKWFDAGMNVVSLPWACDTQRYHPEPEDDRYSDVRVAFVGGYRPYKEAQYRNYLWPYLDSLSTYGYSEWPKAYRGTIPYDDERVLYQNAMVCPSISEPQFAETGDTVERPFKIMGSGGLTVLDCVPAYEELFSPQEVLIPWDVEEHQGMMDYAMTNPLFNLEWRESGYKAVMERHTYKHRAQKILRELSED